MRKVVLLLVLLMVLGSAGYYIYRHGWNLSSLHLPFSASEDEKTTANVKSALSLSKRLSGFDISVDTKGGVVTLTGEVPSEEAKSLAGEIARDTKGVKEVRNEITVNPGAQPSRESVHVEDTEIRSAVLEGIARSPELGGKNIDVKVQNRVVTLSGYVETVVQRNGAEQVARSVPNVAGVVNNLNITNPQAATEPPAAAKPPADPNAELAKRVEFELYRTGAFDTSTIRIRADNGVVTLSGSVRSRAEQLLAERIAQTVDGVKKVTNELQVAALPARR
jgi:osmotically-inducible protein OsmY